MPPFQLTKGQSAPVAANGGISYMAFERDGDAGTTLATADALRQIASGTGQDVIDMIENAPPGPDRDPVGFGFSQSCRVCRVHSRQGHRGAGRRRRVAAALHGARGAVVLDRFVERTLA